MYFRRNFIFSLVMLYKAFLAIYSGNLALRSYIIVRAILRIFYVFFYPGSSSRIFSAFVLVGGLSCFYSCSPFSLSVQTQYFTHEDLASYHIGTPDPHLDHPDIGERLLIQWSLRTCEFQQSSVVLYLKIRFYDHQEKEIQVSIKKKRGYYVYNLMNQEYCDSRGIMTYFAEIRQGDDVIASWKHPLWKNLITINSSVE